MSIVRRVALVVALSAAVIVPAAATAQAVPRVAATPSHLDKDHGGGWHHRWHHRHGLLGLGLGIL
ncbi:hypothetical protein ACFYMW_03660 [Streptomyces sp. NPDC006692]|uniref:hypothetical protein n=1 Tax=unclassified Streptomyces TaxID=2593676 RepID=UPI002E305228|nr:hypothetical protein [Streptomyces sp. NBC_01431]